MREDPELAHGMPDEVTGVMWCGQTCWVGGNPGPLSKRQKPERTRKRSGGTIVSCWYRDVSGEQVSEAARGQDK